MTASSPPYWWQREDLKYSSGRLALGGHDLEPLARCAGKPLFVYSAARISRKLRLLHEALSATGMPFRVFYAMKANRFQPLLCHIRSTGLAGLDLCSPGELQLALSCGFRQEHLSFTAGNLSAADLEILARHTRLLCNLDSLSAIRRFGELAPGREIGLRINPGRGVGYGDNERLRYAGGATTKFGLYEDAFGEALDLARERDLPVRALHMHVGSGFLQEQVGAWEEALAAGAAFLRRAPDVERFNIGGGLGVPHRPGDLELDLGAWARAIQRQLSPKALGGRRIEVRVEPGDYLVKDAGALLLEVNTVELKRDTCFVGLNGGFNLAPEPVYYDLPCQPAPCILREGDARCVTLAGNINEALDIWARDELLPPVEEGDIVALLNAGGYASAMSMNHCLRGDFLERLLV